MSQLKIKEGNALCGTRTMEVHGFTESELSELNSMDYNEMKETVLNTLDEYCDGIGTRWHNGYGVYNMWIKDGAVFVEIGKSCD